MKLELNDLLNNLQGNWKTKKSIYLIKSKLEKKYEEKFNIEKNLSLQKSLIYKLKYNVLNVLEKKYNIQYHQLFIKNNCLNKLNNKQKQLYQTKFIQKNIIQLKYTIPKYNIKYYEYIYFIHSNLNIAISFIKKNNKYLIIIFTSYIKINK